MADSVIEALVQQLFKVLYNESNVYYHEFQTQFHQLVESLTLMTSFPIDAQKLKEYKDRETVKDSLATLREMIYAADDILLDCRIRTGGILSARFRYQTGKRLNEINMQIKQMNNNLRPYLIPMMNQKNNNDESNHSSRWRTTTPTLYNLQSEMVGLSFDTELIKAWILGKNEELQQVGIVGMGGLGKTSLTWKIFNDIEVSDHFEKKIWVSVSQTFSVTQIMKSMLEQLTTQNGGSCTTSDQGKLLEEIRQALKDYKTYLIVMDNVWETENGFVWWEQITRGLRLPKEEKHSCCIIITTRNENVAKSMGVAAKWIHRPRLLDDNESWSLFCKIAFNSSSNKVECEERAKLEKVGKDIVKKCGGLPLAIKTIGGLMSTKRMLNEWEKIREDFHGKLKDNGNYNSAVFASLQLSYDELRPELKHCILCFSIYPEDYIISTEQLVHWWVGEGFVSETKERTATQVAFDYLSELFRGCFINVVNYRGYDGRIFECKMHGMVRDLIIKMAEEEAFCSFDYGYMQQFNSESRHLGLTSEIKTQSLLHQSNSKLRALIWLTNNNPFSAFFSSPSTGLANVNSLRVLDLSQSKLDDYFGIDDLLRWIKSQRRLAYLNLSGVSSLKEVPDWIGKLQNLQTLILTGCHNLEKLSSNVTTLQNLTVLDIGNCSSLQNLPLGLGKLSNLQELSGFKLAASQGATEGCRLGDLKSLTNLRVLRINIQEEDDIKDEELAVLSDLHHLKVLSIDTKDCENEAIIKQLDQLSPPQCLEELYLSYYHGHIIPSWITPSNLPKLGYLCIANGPRLTGMRPSFWVSKHKYWKLTGLCLKYLPRLVVHWVTVQEMMSFIEYVEVSHCDMLRNFPFNDEYLMGIGPRPIRLVRPAEPSIGAVACSPRLSTSLSF